MPEDGKRKGSAMNIDIAQRLYELRREHGYSQESLAEALHLSRQAISKWERAESAPDMGNLIALADLYGMSIDEIVRPDVASVADASSDAKPAEAEDEKAAADEPATTSPESRQDVPQPPTEPDAQGASASPDTPQPPDGQEAPSSTGTPKKGFTAEHAHAHKPERPARLRCGLRRFPFPLLVVVLVLFFAFIMNMWEFVWLFLTIPFYYWIARIIERDPEYRAEHGFPPCD